MVEYYAKFYDFNDNNKTLVDTRRLNTHAVQTWNEMKIEFMTHYQGRDAKAHVYIKSKISHRKSKWTHFLLLIPGHSLKLVKFGKYRTPLDSMKGTPFYEELTNNRFTIDMNDSMPVAADIEPPPAPSAEPAKRNRGRTVLVNRVFTLEVADGLILPKGGDQSGYMLRAMRLFFGDSLGHDHYKELQVPPALTKRIPAKRATDRCAGRRH